MGVHEAGGLRPDCPKEDPLPGNPWGKVNEILIRTQTVPALIAARRPGS